MTTQYETAKDDPELMQKLGELIGRAQKGDLEVLPQLRRVLDTDPTLWRTYGNLAAQAQAWWLKLMAGPDLLLSEATERTMQALRDELAGPTPSPLEKLLVDRVVACWLQLHHADAICAQARIAQPGATIALREVLRRQESSERRYLSSIKALVTVRKLIKPGMSTLELIGGTRGEPLPKSESSFRRGGFAVVGAN